VAQRNGDQGWANLIRCMLAENDLSIGRYVRAKEQLIAALSAFQMFGWSEGEVFAATRLARSAYLQDELGDALAWMDRALRIDQGVQGDAELQFRRTCEFWRAELHAALGHVPEAIACYERSAAACRELNRPMAALEMQAGLARLALSTGDAAQAKAHIAPVIDQMEAGWQPEGIVMDDLRVLLTCHEVLAALGDERAGDFCAVANERMQARAELLEPSDKDAYLGNVPTNRAIGEAWRRMQHTAH
jgi:tetratricopeptide (TPR) repeat protein